MKLKILFLTHRFFPSIGGIEVNSELLAKAFSQNGHEVHLLTWTDDPSKRHFPFLVIRNPGIQRLIKEHIWADVVFENNPCLRLAWVGLFFSKPSVIALNTWIDRADGNLEIQYWAKKVWLKRADKVISVSDAVRRLCWPNATVIGNPYWQSKFRLMPSVSRTLDFAFLGRLVSDKGVDHAIRAIDNLVKTGKYDGQTSAKFSLTIIGDGPERDNLKALVNDLKLDDLVFFLGSLNGDKLTNCLNRHRFLLVPSIWEEPFGNVVLEGMACGCVPIVSNGGGLPDAVGKAGITFERGSVEALVESMRSLLEDPEKELQLRNESKAHLLQHHPDLISKKYLEVIESVV